MKPSIGLLMLAISLDALAGTPVFSVTSNVKGQSELVQGQPGTYIYQITNNTNATLSQIGLIRLPAGVSVLSASEASGTCQSAPSYCQYCSFPLTLAGHQSCLIKLAVNSNQRPQIIQGGPQVCYTANRPVYCSQPLQPYQLSTQILPGPISSDCMANIDNFNAELSQPFDSTVVFPGTVESWGPGRNHLLLSSSNPDLTQCLTTDINDAAAIQWMQKRVLAAEDFWVKQKLNYCHHHVPDFQTPAISYGVPRGQILSGGGYCSAEIDIMEGSYYYGQPVRWNYSGQGSETSNQWLNNNAMWYGLDCSDFTSFIYNFAFGIQFNSDTGYQAGQKEDGSQDFVTPNSQNFVPYPVLESFDNHNPSSPAGVLVCKSGETESENPHCGGDNGYFSVFNGPVTSHPTPTPSEITPEMLNLLQPGDLIFLGFPPGTGKGNNPTSMVTHVITWTGKKVGYGPNDVPPSQIAPQEDACPPNSWQPKIGDWVIIDSHYQGPDYRVLTPCFYQNHIWGVRRVIGYMQ